MPFGGLLTAGLVGAGGSIFSGILGANASKQASQQYIQALQKAQGSLQDTEKQGLSNYQPYLNGGSSAMTNLSSLLGTPGQGLLTPWTGQFTAPTAEQAAQTPGYQFQVQQGTNAMQNSAAGQGSLLTGRTLADLNTFGQGVASTNYQNTFNNALTQYNSAYNSFLNNQQNAYSRLAGTAGMGLQAAGGAGSLISGIGGDIASLYGQQGAAQAQGTIGAANAWGNGISGATNSIGNMLLLRSLNGGGGNPLNLGTPAVNPNPAGALGGMGIPGAPN